jgi:hypothetical protein
MCGLLLVHLKIFSAVFELIMVLDGVMSTVFKFVDSLNQNELYAVICTV